MDEPNEFDGYEEETGIAAATDEVLEGVVMPPIRRLEGYLVPEGALRVKVIEDTGKRCWRKINEYRFGHDSVALDKDGNPQWMTRPVGRPAAETALEPVTPELGELLRLKAAMMRTDPIVQAAEDSPDSADVLHQVVLGIGEEAASLRWERMEAERKGEDSSTLSMRRVLALKSIADTFIKRKQQLQNQEVDLDSPAFQAILAFISETFALTLQEVGTRKEMVDTIFGTFSKKLDDTWKAEAIRRMKRD